MLINLNIINEEIILELQPVPEETNYFKIGTANFSQYVKKMQVSYKPIYNSAMTASGKTVLDIVANKVNLNIDFIYLYEDEMSALLSAMNNLTFDVTYYDPKSKAANTITVYHDTLTPATYQVFNGVILYDPLSIQLAEV